MLLVRQAGIDRLLALSSFLSLAGCFLGSPFGRLRTARCPKLHRSFGLTLAPCGSDSRFPQNAQEAARSGGFLLLVRQAGIEPAAFTFGVCYSIP